MVQAAERTQGKIFPEKRTVVMDNNQNRSKPTDEAATIIIKWVFKSVLAMLALGAICMVFTQVFRR